MRLTRLKPNPRRLVVQIQRNDLTAYGTDDTRIRRCADQRKSHHRHPGDPHLASRRDVEIGMPYPVQEKIIAKFVEQLPMHGDRVTTHSVVCRRNDLPVDRR